MNKFLYYEIAYAALLILFSCTSGYDPFLDSSNARAFAKKAGFMNKDSINIFSTETLEVAVAARDMVDSFMVSAHNNRFFRDTAIHNNGLIPMGPYYTFLISMIDTGWDTIGLTTFKKNGDLSSPEQFVVYCRSPLHQTPIKGSFGQSITLETFRVSDNDVKYHWDFSGINNDFISSDSTLSVTITGSDVVDTNTAGTLYVTDRSGKVRSPGSPFYYKLTDNTGPVIMSFNENYLNADTIKTGDSTFLFKVQIFDLGQNSPVCSATVNGALFDRVVNDKYIKIIPKMDTAKSLISLRVRAMDNLRNKNVSIKDFFIKYSDTIAHVSNAKITVLNPKLDASKMATVSVTPKSIFGSIEDFSGDSLNFMMYLWVNAVKQQATFVTKGQFQAYWSFDIDLSKGNNNVKIIAYKNPYGQSDSVASANFAISYDPALIIADSVPPKILDISASTLAGKLVTNGISDQDTAVVRVIAVDEATYVDTLKINNAAMKSGKTGIQYIWYDTLKIRHRAKGDTIRVEAIDKSNNKTSAMIYVINNRLPKITRTPSPPPQLVAGKAYTDLISAVDPDGDAVFFSKKSGPAGLTVSSSGIITWTPQAPDTGTHDVVIGISDSIQDTVYSYTLAVVNSFENTLPVRFEPVLLKFPSYLEAGRDSIFTTFHIKTGTGKPPFSFFVKNVSAIMKDSVFTWKPVLADTGAHQPMVIVSDQLATSDTLYLPTILVIPPNRPFSLKVTYKIPVLADSSLDMRKRVGPDTLKFSILDPDTFIADNHTVSITQSQTQTVYSLDSSRTFLVILDPSKVDKSVSYGQKDTILVSASDQAGHGQSLRIIVVYSDPIAATVLSKKISFNTTSQNNGAAITTNVFNFPVLVRLDKTSFDFSVVNKTGQNIYFKKANGGGVPFEIDLWDSANGVAAIWVRVDTVYANSTAQFITLAWGDSDITQHSSGADVFQAADGFAGVWHLSEGGTGKRFNSVASNTYPATPLGYLGNESKTGLVGKADSLCNANDHDSIPNISFPLALTVSVWVAPSTFTNNGKIIFSPAPNGQTNVSIEEGTFVPGSAPKAIFRMGFVTQFGINVERIDTSKTALQIDQWTNILGTFSGSKIDLYINGNFETTTPITDNILNGVYPFYLGFDPNNSGLKFFGKIDEPRISTGTPPSADWIKLSYENQRPIKDGSAFIAIK